MFGKYKDLFWGNFVSVFTFYISPKKLGKKIEDCLISLSAVSSEHQLVMSEEQILIKLISASTAVYSILRRSGESTAMYGVWSTGVW